VLAVLAPGQGSQKPGFLTPWLALPGAEARLRWWSVLAGVEPPATVNVRACFIMSTKTFASDQS